MKILDLAQGSAEWHAARAKCRTASEAPAMMGASKYLRRTELLRMKHFGMGREVSEWTQMLYDKGHAAEASARPLVEQMLAPDPEHGTHESEDARSSIEQQIGEELFPVTATDGNGWLLASFDGITMAGDVGFEHKLWNESLAEQVRAGDLTPHYYWQLEQQILVGGLDRIVFVCSDGTPERFEHMEYRAVPGRAEQLLAGWRQFDADLAEYVPTAPTVPAVAAPVQSLPAVSVRLDGQLVVASNLPEFAAALAAFIDRIPLAPETDQQFADADAACKALRKAEYALEASEEQALAQMSDVEAMRRTIRDLRELARSTRLSREKMVAARKEQIRLDTVQTGMKKLAAHVAKLNVTIGQSLMPAVRADFPAAIRGKRTMDSLRDAVDVELARAKIEADAIGSQIIVNLRALQNCEHRNLLFPDTPSLVLKETDHLKAVIGQRLAQHRRIEEARDEAERARIRAEEQAKARALAEGPAPAPAAARVTLVSAPMFSGADPGDDGGRLNLSAINARLAPIQITAGGLATLGFEPAGRVKAACLYRAADFDGICDALILHVKGIMAYCSHTEDATA